MAFQEPNLKTTEDALRTLSPMLDELKAKGIDPLGYLATVLQGEDKAKVRTIGAALVEQKTLSAADWKKTERLSRAQDALGAIPVNATHFLELYLIKFPIDVSARGEVTPQTLPSVFGAQLNPNLPGDDAALHAAVVSHYKDTFSLIDLQRKMEIMSDDLKFGYTAAQISNVIVDWHKQRKLDEWSIFAANISYDRGAKSLAKLGAFGSCCVQVH
jgi:hypothetical protein